MSNGDPRRDFYRWARRWPTWLLVVVCIAGAAALALYDRLDDWLRAIGAVLFAAAALALTARALGSNGKSDPGE